ncbi:uncharacterized protein [Anabrus simplex]|uniref:uncharacterized protein n=1 Tax=Anabrus simplex TaxID=316456 RepID=UPI0035A34DE3
MLPDSNLPVAEIMQTEESNSKTLDEVSTLIHSSDIEMTVKEDLEDQPLEASEKPPNTTPFLLDDECIVTEPSDKHSVIEHDHSEGNGLETLRTKNSSSSQESQQPQIISPDIHEPSAESDGIQDSTSTSYSSECASVIGATESQQKNERGKGRGRRRSRWKLKFHHQALPPEYLDHYEASMAQQEASAAAKSASTKADNKGKSCGLPSAKSVPILAPRSSPGEKVSGKQVPSPSQCFIKIESDHPQFNAVTSPLANTVDHLHILPIQALTVGSDSDTLKRLPRDVSNKDEISIISEKPPMNVGKLNQNSGKGLLGSLLSNTTETMEISGKVAIETEHKRRSSVIMSSSSSGNVNNIPSRSSTPAIPVSSSNNGNCSKIVNYQDLPYMGEITLDNMKPRRGRKPKKADICHLIYKNYGTIFPGTPNRGNPVEREEWSRRKLQESSQNISSPTSANNSINNKVKSESSVLSSLKCKPFELLKSSGQLNHSDVQNRIISSLLEKRLTAASQDAKKYMFGNMDFISSSGCDGNENTNIVSSSHDVWNAGDKQNPTSTNVNDEPLNLCIKDLNQLKIRLLRKHGNFYEPRMNDVISVKSEPPSPSEIEELDLCDSPIEHDPKFIHEPGLHEAKPQASSIHQQEGEDICESFPFPSMDCPSIPPTPLLPMDAGGPAGPLPGGYIYWPSAGVFVHPMALQSQLLYYQKMGAIPLVPITPSEPCQTFLPSQSPQVTLTPQSNSVMPSASQINSPKNIHNKEQKSNPNKSQIPKAFSMMMEASSKSAVPSEAAFPRMKRLAPLGNPPAVGAPTKRKRSAIFIPPMPTENSTNPTTEVSICKFKFTGGAKPSLQEKKMLSVDSGGNFRYYSGTGDKSMRGYEFFPRESLQQPPGSSGTSPSEQFLAASALANGEKMLATTNLPFVHEDHRTGHLKQVTGLSETVVKTSSESVGRLTDSSSQLYEHQTSVESKKSDMLTNGRPAVSGGACASGGSSGNSGDRFGPSVNVPDDSSPHSQFRLRRKRKTRKSLAREKLEQTFKEKGFLIQTQQLESAEGATYCKFRQLRKFTRYLFRSWKDYLPGNVREMSVAAGVAGADTSPTSECGQVDSEVEGELSSSNSPSPSTLKQVTDSSPTQLSNT